MLDIAVRLYYHLNDENIVERLFFGGRFMKITNAEEFGKAIRERRKKLKYTQNDLSEITGLSASYISNLENGKATAEIGKAILLANVVGLNVLLEERS